jgi:hypothetical protein
MTDGNIGAARTKLDRAFRKLFDKRMAVYHDRTMYAPSLYEQLKSDLAGTQGDTRTPAKSLPPIWIDASMLLTTIDRQCHTWMPKPGSTFARMGSLVATSWRPQDTEKVTGMAKTVDGWAESIINLIDPRAQVHITAPCPSCGKAIVYRRDSGGDLVRQEALKWTPNAGFQCQACKASWSPEQTLFFAKLLGIELPPGVME